MTPGVKHGDQPGTAPLRRNAGGSLQLQAVGHDEIRRFQRNAAERHDHRRTNPVHLGGKIWGAAPYLGRKRRPIITVRADREAEHGVRYVDLMPAEPRLSEELVEPSAGLVPFERDTGPPRAAPAGSLADKHDRGRRTLGARRQYRAGAHCRARAAFTNDAEYVGHRESLRAQRSSLMMTCGSPSI